MMKSFQSNSDGDARAKSLHQMHVILSSIGLLYSRLAETRKNKPKLDVRSTTLLRGGGKPEKTSGTNSQNLPTSTVSSGGWSPASNPLPR
jgi:hypothetical protein